MKAETVKSLFFTIVLCFVPISTFAPYEIIDNYFQLFPIACAVCISALVACGLLIFSSVKFEFAVADGLLAAYTGYYLLIYDYEEQLAEWKIVYAVLLCVFWFASRFILSSYPIQRKVLLYGLALLGCIQAIWGGLQLYGFADSYHKMYAVTGSFYNPGPYTGCLAVVFPICLGQFLVARNADRYIWATIMALLFSMIPAGMSRSAWGALAISSLFVLSFHYQWIGKLKTFSKLHIKTALLAIIFSMIISGLVVSLLFAMKPDSAFGRLFIWKQTIGIIAQSPLIGSGPGSFPQLYGKQQSVYFEQGNFSEREERVAGTPAYAFNEYLQLTVEGGLVMLLLVCTFLFLTIQKGVRMKQYGVCGGLLCLCIFAFSAYPLQVLPLGMIGILLSSICVSVCDKDKEEDLFLKVISNVVAVFLFVVSLFCVYRLRDVNDYKSRIEYASILYSESLYQEAFSAYASVYKKMKHNPKLLLRYARALMEQQQYRDAIEVLERAEKVCCDVAILNMKGSCFQLLGEYEYAEVCFLESARRLPIRIYPYYMLAKLYADSTYFDKEKFEQMKSVVLTKKPKVYSNAIQEMRNEIRKLSIKTNY